MFTMDQIDATHTAYKMGIEASREVSATRIAELEAALRHIEYLDRPQVRGQPRRVSIQEIALAALKGGSDE